MWLCIHWMIFSNLLLTALESVSHSFNLSSYPEKLDSWSMIISFVSESEASYPTTYNELARAVLTNRNEWMPMDDFEMRLKSRLTALGVPLSSSAFCVHNPFRSQLSLLTFFPCTFANSCSVSIHIYFRPHGSQSGLQHNLCMYSLIIHRDNLGKVTLLVKRFKTTVILKDNWTDKGTLSLSLICLKM